MTLTKQQRNTIYTEALHNFKENIGEDFICGQLSDLTNSHLNTV